MQALTVHALSDDLSGVSLDEMQVPERRSGQVLVKVRAASLNFPDLLMARGQYQLKPPLPFVPGMDLAGEVVEADPDCAFAIGDAVVAATRLGAFAGYALVDVAAVQPKPMGLSFAQAASYGAAYLTAYVALMELGGVRAGQWVLVHGASGGVGLAAVDLAKALGARVIAASGSAAKLAVVADAYAPDATLVSQGRFRDEVAAITGGVLCDLVYDPVGGDVFDESTRCVGFGGKLLVVGFASGRIADVSTNIPLIKGFSVVGVRAGEYTRRFPERGTSIRAEVAAMVADGKVKPRVDRILPLSRWREGFEAMARRELIGKVVFEPGA